MPLKDWNLKATWDAAYSSGAEGLDSDRDSANPRAEMRLHYHKAAQEGIAASRAQRLAAELGPAQFNKRVLIIGGGFGWTAEVMLLAGFTGVIVTDTSVYVQAEQNNTEEAEIRAEITAVGLDPDTGRGAVLLSRHTRSGNRRPSGITLLDEDVSMAAGRNAIRAAAGGNLQIVVTESVLESLTDAEAQTLSADIQSMQGPQDTYHLVYTPSVSDDPGYNFQSLAAWKLLIPGDTFIDAQTFEVL